MAQNVHMKNKKKRGRKSGGERKRKKKEKKNHASSVLGIHGGPQILARVHAFGRSW